MKKYIYHSITVFSSAIIQFLIIRTFSVYIGIYELGIYLLVLGYLTPLTVLANLGLKNYWLSNSQSSEDKLSILGGRLLGLVAIISISTVIFIAFSIPSLAIFYFVLCYKVFESLSELNSAILIKENKNHILAMIGLLRLVLVSIVTIAFIYDIG
ncbi:hypothetical protein L1D29_19450, partial [Shewanella insulae]|uniref:hypothetical protein n=1 Tax=Shewanella insulae TaxID=2681496 RepID=UPI001EFC96E5